MNAKNTIFKLVMDLKNTEIYLKQISSSNNEDNNNFY
jgi:hypothetical protein